MFLEIFLFAVNPGLFHLQTVRVFQLCFGLLELDLADDSFKVVVNLAHNADFAALHFFGELIALRDQNLRPVR